jgi:hypothetical protein
MDGSYDGAAFVAVPMRLMLSARWWEREPEYVFDLLEAELKLVGRLLAEPPPQTMVFADV